MEIPKQPELLQEVLKANNILKERFEIYKLETETNNNTCFILYDKTQNYFYEHISLITINDIFINLLPETIILYLNNTEYVLKTCNESELTIKDWIVNNQKIIFGAIKNFVLVNKINIVGITYRPINDKIINEYNKIYLNLFQRQNNFIVEKKDNYNFNHIEFLLKNILQEGYNKFLDLLAHKKQFPLEIITCHWVIQDKGGTAKTQILINMLLCRLFNVNIIYQSDLESPFNEYLVNSEFLVCEEVEGFEDEKKLKVLTGSKLITINEKFKRPFSIMNYNNMIINSNELKAIKINYEDRRFNIVGGGKRIIPLNNDWGNSLFESEDKHKEFFKGFHNNFSNELKDLNSYLHFRKYDKNSLYIPLNTKQRKDLIENNLMSEQIFINEIIQDGIMDFVGEYTTSTTFIDELLIQREDNNFIKIGELYNIYNKFCEKGGYKRLQKNNFLKRCKDYGRFNEIFGDIEHIWYKNKTCKVLVYKKSLEPELKKSDIDIIEMGGDLN